MMRNMKDNDCILGYQQLSNDIYFKRKYKLREKNGKFWFQIPGCVGNWGKFPKLWDDREGGEYEVTQIHDVKRQTGTQKRWVKAGYEDYF